MTRQHSTLVRSSRVFTRFLTLISLTFAFFVGFSYLYVTNRLNWRTMEEIYMGVASKVLTLFS